MNELKMKRKGSLNKILKNQIIVTCATVLMASLILMGTSYALLKNDDVKNEPTVDIKIGNMQAVLSSNSMSYTFDKDYQKPVSDASGLSQNPYNFSLTNTGDSDIEYYEIRMVDQENKKTTLPHKYIRFSLRSNKGEYSNPNNLGDVNSIIYTGYNLKKGDKIEFDLKMWIDERSPNMVLNKELYGALEVTLYQKYDVYNYYVLYDSDQGKNNPARTSIHEPITSIIPERDNYYFLGWSTEKNGDVNYNPGDTYRSEKGMTLYAIWKIVE